MKIPTKQELAKARVLVVGDAMLDRYWHGAVDRISPEAPGARGQGLARRGAHRRRRQRRLQHHHTGRTGQLSRRGRGRRARPPARGAAARNRHRGPPQARSRPEDDREAARHRPAAAAIADGLRERARPRGAGFAGRGLRPARARARRGAVLRLRQGRTRAYHRDDPCGSRQQESRAGRPQGIRLLALCGCDRDHAEPHRTAAGGRRMAQCGRAARQGTQTAPDARTRRTARHAWARTA